MRVLRARLVERAASSFAYFTSYSVFSSTVTTLCLRRRGGAAWAPVWRRSAAALSKPTVQVCAHTQLGEWDGVMDGRNRGGFQPRRTRHSRHKHQRHHHKEMSEHTHSTFADQPRGQA